MITPSDEDYQQTKRVVRGQESMSESLAKMAGWMEATFRVPILNIRLERMDQRNNRPRLNLIFEYIKDYEKLMDDFFTIKSIVETDIKTACYRFLEAEEDLNGLFIIFSSFAPVARNEANFVIPDAEIEGLKKRLDLGKLWTISRFGGIADFMLYTEEQVRRFKTNGMHEQLSRAYFELLKPHDEFDYFDKETFLVELGSKEDFDKNYNGNWQFYYQ